MRQLIWGASLQKLVIAQILTDLKYPKILVTPLSNYDSQNFKKVIFENQRANNSRKPYSEKLTKQWTNCVCLCLCAVVVSADTAPARETKDKYDFRARAPRHTQRRAICRKRRLLHLLEWTTLKISPISTTHFFGLDRRANASDKMLYVTKHM